jgi:hypothetical protein
MRAGVAVLVVAVAVLVVPAQGLADIVDLGYVSFDNLIPAGSGSPGVNGFTIANLTGDPASGGNDLPPGFAAFTPVTFLNSSLEWFSDNSSQTVSLGDLGPGFFNPLVLQFSDSATFTSALFTATLDMTAFQLDPSVGGGIFMASSDQISVLLQPSSGNSLVASTDYTLIAVSSVPEPNSLFLLGSVLGFGLMWLHRFRAAKKDQRF